MLAKDNQALRISHDRREIRCETGSRPVDCFQVPHSNLCTCCDSSWRVSYPARVFN